MTSASTAVLLRRLRLGLLLCTVIALAGSLLAIGAGRDDAETMRTAAAPAREGLAAARYSVVRAHAEALTGFQGAGTAAGDPGEQYRTAVAAAGRQLAQVSESEIEATVKQGVQVVESLFAAYLGLMEQARVHLRDDGGSLLAQSYLRYAHNLLYEEMLPQFQSLSADVDAATPDGDGRWRILWWAVPVLCLLGLLAVAQVFLARRFRRVIIVPLLVATVLTLLLGGVAWTSSRVAGDVGDSRGDLTSLVGEYSGDERALADSCASLPPESSGAPRPSNRACPSTSAAAADRELLVRARGVAETSREAAATGTQMMAAATVLALLIALLILLGLQPRIEEYRFRSR